MHLLTNSDQGPTLREIPGGADDCEFVWYVSAHIIFLQGDPSDYGRVSFCIL